MFSRKPLFVLLLLFCLLIGCSSQPAPVAPITLTPNQFGLSGAEYDTLTSLQKLDDYPLYVMHYYGSYPFQSSHFVPDQALASIVPVAETCQMLWGCSLFAALGDESNRFYGRNFDWRFSPALVLYTDPPDGYASVSMVDIAYLGFDGDKSKNLMDLSIPERKTLMGAPALPFDGMNEKGIAVGMAAVPPGEMKLDPGTKTVDQLMIIREILDHAATVDEAIQILGSYNIDMGTVPIHYLIASASGNSALVEFYKGEMKVFRNGTPWQQATNFLVASTNGKNDGQCPRYDLIGQRLGKANGRIAFKDALDLLSDVSQGSTQWSVVYNMSSGEIKIVMDKQYSGEIHTFHLDQAH